MATTKATTKPTAKVKAKVEEAKAVEVKAEQMKLDVVEEKAAEKATKKAATKKATTAKKETAKKATTKTAAKKEAVKASVNVQFAGKSYGTDDLVKIAKDVWKYDLKNKVADFKSVDLYVKPEESMVYYVINGDVAGSFEI